LNISNFEKEYKKKKQKTTNEFYVQFCIKFIDWMSESTDLYGNPFADQSFTASLATHYQRVDKDFRYDDEEEEEENNSHRNRIKDDDSSQRSYMIEERESLSSLNETYPAQKIESIDYFFSFIFILKSNINYKSQYDPKFSFKDTLLQGDISY